MHNETPKTISIGNRVIPGTAHGFRLIIWSLICFGNDSLVVQSSLTMGGSKYFKETELVCELGDVLDL